MVEVNKTRGTYLLSELDGTIMDGIFPGEQLKRFFLRRGVAADAEVEEDAEAGERDVEPDDGSIAAGAKEDEGVVGDDGKVDKMEE